MTTSVLFFGKISPLGNKKNGLANPTGFLRFFSKKFPYLDQKNLEVAKFR
jgi:hypothetical protein